MFWFKKIISTVVTFLVRLLNFINYKITDYAHNPNKNNYEDLTPSDNADVDNGYSSALEWALKTENIKNIAISGPFGSGKSSVLRTFEKKHAEWKYLNISLACFGNSINKATDDNNKEEDDGENAIKENRNSLVEKSVLQQIFYQVKGSKVPYSKLRRITDISTSELFATAVGIVTLLVAAILLYSPNHATYKAIIDTLGYKEVIKEYYLLLPLAVVIIGVFYLVKFIVGYVRLARFTKISIAGGKVELGDDTAILNQHMDEILYFFEKTNYNVVVVEDLDRFEEVNIFPKLRELNSLINSSKQVNRKVVFIYAIRDDFFQGQDRTKFFDFIIPVIPIINPSNSGEMLLDKLDRVGLLGSIPKDFIYYVTSYIAEMRLLRNIYNEFAVYKSKLSTVELNITHLFGFIVYKNIFPEDFACLHNNKGIVADSFRLKDESVHKQKADLNSQIKYMTNEIQLLEKEQLKSIKELRSIYLVAFAKKSPGVSGFHLQKGQVHLGNVTDDTFEQLLSMNKIQLYIKGALHNSNISFKDIETEVDPNHSYLERKALIEKKIAGESETLRNKIGKLRKDIREIETLTLMEFIEKFPNFEFIPSKKEKEENHDLLKYLLRNGYIDEMYHHFISFFYEGSLTQDDADFIFSIKNKKALDPTHSLTHMDEVIKRINHSEFSTVEVLNFDLLDFLLASTDEEHSEFLKQIIDQLKTSRNTVEFIDAHLEKTKHESKFINKLCGQWAGFWRFIEEDSNYPLEKKNSYLMLILKHCDIENIVNVNEGGVLTEFITNSVQLFSLVSKALISTGKFKDVMIQLNVHIAVMDNPVLFKELFECVYEHNIYELNISMIKLVVNHKSPVYSKGESNFEPNYSSILDSECANLIDYVNSNLIEYIDNVYLKLDGPCNEREAPILALLNKYDLSYEQKTAVINKAEFRIEDIESVDDPEDLWLELLKASKIKASWDNLFSYYQQNEEVDDAMISFLNLPENFKLLSESSLSENEDDSADMIEQFYKKTLEQSEISDEAYDLILNSISMDFDTISLNEISDSKVKILINRELVSMTDENIALLKEKSTNLCALLLKSNIDDYINRFDEFDPDPGADVIQALLGLKGFSDDNKISLIQKVSHDFIDENPSIANLIYAILLSAKEGVKLNIEMLKKLIEFGDTTPNKVKLLTLNIPLLNTDEITSILTLLGDKYSQIADRKQPTLNNNGTNTALAEALIDKGYISSISPNLRGLKIYQYQKKWS